MTYNREAHAEAHRAHIEARNALDHPPEIHHPQSGGFHVPAAETLDEAMGHAVDPLDTDAGVFSRMLPPDDLRHPWRVAEERDRLAGRPRRLRRRRERDAGAHRRGDHLVITMLIHVRAKTPRRRSTQWYLDRSIPTALTLCDQPPTDRDLSFREAGTKVIAKWIAAGADGHKVCPACCDIRKRSTR